MLSKMPRAFPMPVLTTPDLSHSVTEKPDHQIGTTEIIYPDEILVLREILQEIVLSNNSVIDYILYGDMLATDNDATKILTTTEKVKDTKHHALANNSTFLIERQNTQKLPRTVKAAKIVTEEYDESISNYDAIDTGIKILESMVAFTKFNAKSTAAKARFNIKDNKNQERATTGNIIDNSEERPDLKDDQKNIPNDSSSYYEDGSGISIETTITTEPSTKNNIEKSYTSFKRIKLEDYKNVIFNINPSRESRGIVTIDNKNIKHESERYIHSKNKIWKDNSYTNLLDRAENKNTRKSTKTFKSIKHGDHENLIFNLNPFKEGRDNIITVHKKQEKYTNGLESSKNNNKRNIRANYESMESETDNKLIVNKKTETAENFPLGKAMAISDEDFEYEDKRIDKPEYYTSNNMRSRFDNREPIYWRN